MADVTMWQDEAKRQQFVARGQLIFAQLRPEIKEQDGVIALDLKSGDYFVGATLGQANDAARQKYLDHWLYFVRLDNEAAAIPLPVW